MNRFKKVFSKRHTFLPVIHVQGGNQALRNACIAQDNGADGIWLINHDINFVSLLECYVHVERHMPDFWIGLNCLELGMHAIDVIPDNAKGLWTDNAGIDEDDSCPITGGAQQFFDKRRKRNWKGLYFGGVAFKYQEQVKDVALAAKLAAPHMDVVTTSGKGTGHAPDVTKLRLMKEAIGDHPLANASGATPDNVHEFMPWVDVFLVATGISKSHTELDPYLVRAFANRLM